MARASRLRRRRIGRSTSPPNCAKVLAKLEETRKGTNVSLADLIVLAGNVGVEQAAKAGGFDVKVPFTPGRTDATQEQTDVDSFKWLEPKADGFRNWYPADAGTPPDEMLIDRAQLLSLTIPEMTVLIGGLRAIGANFSGSKHGVFTNRPGALSNDVFVNLLDMGVTWRRGRGEGNLRSARPQDRRGQVDGDPRRSPVRLQLAVARDGRGLCGDDAKPDFVNAFVAAWTKVMELDRFDVSWKGAVLR